MKESARIKDLENKCKILDERLFKCSKDKTELEKDLRTTQRKTVYLIVSVAVQFLVVLGIGFSVHYAARNIDLTHQNILQQGEFNRSSLRPWIVTHPLSNLNVIYDTLIYEYFIMCGGFSPAVNVLSGSGWSGTDTFPPIKMETVLPMGILPHDTMWVNNRKRRLETQPKLYDDELKEFIKKNKLFLHVITFYEDLDSNKYNFRGTYQAKGYDGTKVSRWTCIKMEFDEFHLEKYRPN